MISAEGGEKLKLVNAVGRLGQGLAAVLLASVDRRFEPYFSYYKAMQLVDPSAPVAFAGAEGRKTQVAFEDLCGRFDLDPKEVKRELALLQNRLQHRSTELQRDCELSLLRLYHKLEEQGKLRDYPNAKQFVQCVFSTPLTTVKVETLFSVMGYNKSGSRCNMRDDTTAAIAQVQHLEPQLEDPGNPTRTMRINTEKALLHDLAPTHQR
jgi:hypothetical protein